MHIAFGPPSNKTNKNSILFALSQLSFFRILGECALAMKVNCQTDENDQLLRMVKRSMAVQIDFTAVLASLFPEIESLLAWMFKGGRKRTNEHILNWCEDILRVSRVK